MVAAIENRSFIVDVQCWSCRNIFSMILNRKDLVDWTVGSGNIENVLYYLSNSERELLISQTCGECFDKLFQPLDNEE